METGNPSTVISARCPHMELRQFANVQLTVVIKVQPVEFRLHKGHELLLGNFATLVRIHQEQQLFGRWHSSVDLLGVISGDRSSCDYSDYERCFNCPREYPSFRHDAPPPRLFSRC